MSRMMMSVEVVMMIVCEVLWVGLVFIFDCVFGGVYQDQGILVLQEWFVNVFISVFEVEM